MSLKEAELVFERLPYGLTKKQVEIAVQSLRRVLILKTFWYPEVVDALEKSATSFLNDMGVESERLVIRGVPGAFELPLAAKLAANTRTYDLIVALGCVVRGGTPHFEFVCKETVSGLSQVSLEHGLPIGMGVLTLDDLDQAQSRLNKGQEAAQAALLMWAVKRESFNA